MAHPDDEILWAGGVLLLHPEWHCHIHTLCRASDRDRAPRFMQILAKLGADGGMADLDDGEKQTPLTKELVRQVVYQLLGRTEFDVLLTHGPAGEYTWHRRHVEVSKAVTELWQQGRLHARELWMFAYEDGHQAYLPRAVAAADRQFELPPATWEEKYRLIREVYGFSAESWEARATPRREAFWRFTSPELLKTWLHEMEVSR